MMIASDRVLDRLPADEQCLGALFTSYSFDPAFFEDHVLRAVLRLASDPVEQADRYHHEARRALQETPVVAIVDAGERQPGRRLPFDLLEVSDLVFHPKAVLLLYRKFARLQIGSGNLTRSGYGDNTELFLCRELAYGNDADAALLMAFGEHLNRVRSYVRRTGTQLKLIQQELHRRVRPVSPEARTGSVAFLDSTTRPILEQFTALLPDTAVIQSIGMLAPYYERDDAGLDATSVFGALSPRAGSETVLDVGVAWDNPEVQCSDATELKEGLGRLWTWSRINEGQRELEHLVPTSVGPQILTYIDESGKCRRCRINEVLEALDQRDLWMQPTPQAFAPRNTVAAVTERFAEVRIWLHPSTRLVHGRPVHRPLHAKLLVVSYQTGRSSETLILMGSPNMSRPALLMPVGAGKGNVEVAFAFRLAMNGSLRDFLPELVFAPKSTLELMERTFPESPPNYSLAIEDAIYDPRNRNLTVTWSSKIAHLPAWRLTYDAELLADSATTRTTTPLTIPNFVLKPSTAEVVLHVDGFGWSSVPILVTDLVALPATPVGTEMDLNELLMLLGHRIGAERAVQLAALRAVGAGDGEGLDSFFGEGFGPTDVFRAWWSVAEELKKPDLSVQAFRLRLEGSLGIGAAWSCMLNAIDENSLTIEETWFYGAELLRTLAEIELPGAEDQDAKGRLLDGFRERVRKDIGRLQFDDSGRPWLDRIVEFYGEPMA